MYGRLICVGITACVYQGVYPYIFTEAEGSASLAWGALALLSCGDLAGAAKSVDLGNKIILAAELVDNLTAEANGGPENGGTFKQ